MHTNAQEFGLKKKNGVIPKHKIIVLFIKNNIKIHDDMFIEVLIT